MVDGEDTARQREVQLGPVVDGLRVIRSGVAAGDRAVVNGLQRVRPNQKVTPEMRSLEDGAARAQAAAGTGAR